MLWVLPPLAVLALVSGCSSGGGAGAVRDAATDVLADGGAPVAVAIVVKQPGPSAIAVNATDVYWADMTAGILWKVGKDGGTPVSFASAGNDQYGLALDKTRAYFTDYDTGEVMSVPLDGGTTETLATTCGAGGIAVDATYVYWATASPMGAVLRVTKTGGQGRS
jgi:hypothetical protein